MSNAPAIEKLALNIRATVGEPAKNLQPFHSRWSLDQAQQLPGGQGLRTLRPISQESVHLSSTTLLVAKGALVAEASGGEEALAALCSAAGTGQPFDLQCWIAECPEPTDSR